MFKEELEAVRKAETDAEALRISARAEAKRLSEEAVGEAKAIREQAEAKAAAVIAGYMSEGEQEAEQAYGMTLRQAEETAKDIATKAEASMREAVDMIAERIVEIGVNR